MMGWQDTLAMLLGRKAARRLIALDRIGQPLWSPRRYDKFADEGFRKNVIAFRSISEVAQAAASVPWRLRRRRGDEWVEVNSHPLLALLRRPNPLQGGPALFESAYAFRFIAGNAFIEAVAPEGRPPVELYALRPDRMRVIPGAAGLPAAYRYGVGGRTRDYPVDQVTGRSAILHLRAFHRLQDPRRRALRALFHAGGLREGSDAPARAYRGQARRPDQGVRHRPRQRARRVVNAVDTQPRGEG